MVDNRIIDYIKTQKNAGYNDNQIRLGLKQSGYDDNIINEAFQKISGKNGIKDNQVLIEKPKGNIFDTIKEDLSNINKIYLYIIIAIIFISLVSAGVWYSIKPVCGNHKIENGETPETCCIDAGCIGDQTCENNVCKDPMCNSCEYLEDHKCIRYECCEDMDCRSYEKCNITEHSCYEIQCSGCQEAINHKCERLDCCNDNDCQGDEFCSSSHVCERLECQNCSYIDNHQCMMYECCNDDMCSNGKRCSNHECVLITCGNCQYLSEHTCLDYNCCTNSTCNDYNESTMDVCLYPGTLQSYCFFTNKTICTNGTQCNDYNPQTIDTCEGDYPKFCIHTNITGCSGNEKDGFCYPGCNYHNDSDCADFTVDCNNNITCLYEQSKDCSFAEGEETRYYDPDVLGFIRIEEHEYEIKGSPINESNKCEFKNNLKSIRLELNDTAREILKSNLDLTDEQVDNLIQEKNNEVQSDRYDYDCVFITSELTDMLNKWKDKNYDDTYFLTADCEDE